MIRIMQQKLGAIFTIIFAVMIILNPVFADSESPATSDSPYLEPSENSQKYQSVKHGIAFSVPEGWFLQELDKTEEDSPDVVAVGPKIGGMSPVISLTVKQTSLRTLDDLISEKTEKLRHEVESGNLEIISQEKIVVNGNQAHVTNAEGIFSSDGKKFDVKFKEVMVYDSDKFYTLAYSNSINNFDSQLPKFEEAVDSFEILAEKNADNLKYASISKPINERNEILERLSYLFAEQQILDTCLQME